MILQALNRYYERSSTLPRKGWIRRGVDYVIVLDTQGECINLESVGELRKGKTQPAEILVTAIGKQAMKHTNSGKDANLLWDNASFVFGTGNKGDIKLSSFLATLDGWLGALKDPAVEAVHRFCLGLQTSPEGAGTLVERFQAKDDFDKRDPVLVFRLVDDLEYVHMRPAVRSAFESALVAAQSGSALRGNCLVTGEIDLPLAPNESVIKGVWGGQPAGCNIVSFNARAFESYGKRERNGQNAPISVQASFAYTTALNHLLSSRQRIQVGDASTVFWAEEKHELENIFGEVMHDDPDRGADALRALYRAVETGRFAVGSGDTRFHVLGLAPNAARIAVRFWETAPAIELAHRIKQHFDDLRVARAPHDPEHLSLFRLLVATAVQGKADNIPPKLGGEVMRAIIDDLPYPATLLNAAVQRCRAERQVTYPRAAAIKAWLNRDARRQRLSNPTREEFTPMLDPDNPSAAYRLGRLFATLEKIQEEASPGLNATIRDRYYGAASSSPATVFPILLRLKNHHVSKLDERGRRMLFRAFQDNKPDVYIGMVLDRVPDIPSHLALQDQGRFALGYYHQRQAFFTRRDHDIAATQGEPA